MTDNLKIKVCGMRDEGNITNLINAVSPNFIGLIFYKKSKRLVNKKLNTQTLQFIKNHSQLVGVFVEQSMDETLQKVKHHQLDYLQLHGGERHDYQFCRYLKSKGHKIIKVFQVSNQTDISREISDFANLKDFSNVVDYLMFDTLSNQYGGLGKRFDWSVIPTQISIPYFLSGGLSLENITDVKNFIKDRKKNKQSIPFCLDLNSKFEISPALKDIKQIESYKKQLLVKNN